MKKSQGAINLLTYLIVAAAVIGAIAIAVNNFAASSKLTLTKLSDDYKNSLTTGDSGIFEELLAAIAAKDMPKIQNLLARHALDDAKNYCTEAKQTDIQDPCYYYNHNQNLLYGQKVADAGAAVLAATLKESKVLTKLGLSGTEISDAGILTLAEALKSNTTLEHLDLNDNLIGNYGASAIADALKVNMTLKVLYLNGNNIDDASVNAIADALRVNTVLQYLYLPNLISNRELLDNAKSTGLSIYYY